LVFTSLVDFDDHQSNYVFHSVQNENIQDKAQVLRDLLTKYQNLPTDCKERAEPVKEYIESHLAMVEHMGSKGLKTETAPPVTGKPKVKKGSFLILFVNLTHHPEKNYRN